MVVIKAATRVGSRLIRRSAIAMVAAVLLTGCASTQNRGIPLQSDAADPELQELAIKAKGGDKQAQYELGRWFESSSDPDGMKKAIKLYRIAATPRGGERMIYTLASSGATTSIVSLGPIIEPNRDAEVRLRYFQVLLTTQGAHRSGSRTEGYAPSIIQTSQYKMSEKISRVI